MVLSLFCLHSRLAAVKRKLAELNKLVDSIQQSSAHIRGMESHVTGRHSGDTKANQTAATVGASEMSVQHVAASQKEMEREQRWERSVIHVCALSVLRYELW